MKKRKHRKWGRRAFTLVELIVSMAVFALLSMVVVQLFSATQKLWVSNNQKNQISADGRTALNMIASLLTTTSAAPKANQMSNTATPAIEASQGGVDYFELERSGNFSSLYFVSKTTNPGVLNANANPICFVGIGVVDVNSGEDDGYNALAMAVLDSNDAGYSDNFPETDFARIKSQLNRKINNGGSQVAYLASCILEFNVRLYNVRPGRQIERPREQTLTIIDKGSTRTESSIDSIAESIASGGGDTSRNPDTDDSTNATASVPNYTYPAAVELELVLMDKVHYKLYVAATTGTEQTRLRNQYARRFRKLVWLDAYRHVDDYNLYNP